jgi:hypothetical protein
MQEHLRRWLREPGLTAEQRALIPEGAKFLTPAVYTSPGAPERQDWERFWSRAEPAFPSGSGLPWFDLVLSPSTRATTRPGRTGEVACECNDAHPSDCGLGQCTFGGCQQGLGCGPGLIYWCNGTCAQAATSAPE